MSARWRGALWACGLALVLFGNSSAEEPIGRLLGRDRSPAESAELIARMGMVGPAVLGLTDRVGADHRGPTRMEAFLALRIALATNTPPDMLRAHARTLALLGPELASVQPMLAALARMDTLYDGTAHLMASHIPYEMAIAGDAIHQVAGVAAGSLSDMLRSGRALARAQAILFAQRERIAVLRPAIELRAMDTSTVIARDARGVRRVTVGELAREYLRAPWPSSVRDRCEDAVGRIPRNEWLVRPLLQTLVAAVGSQPLVRDEDWWARVHRAWERWWDAQLPPHELGTFGLCDPLTPISAFQGLSSSEIDSLQLKITNVGIQLEPIPGLLMAEVGRRPSIAPFLAFRRDSVPYGNEDFGIYYPVHATHRELGAILGSLVTMPVMSASPQVNPIISVALSTAKPTRVFEALLDSNSADILFRKLSEALADNDSALEAISHLQLHFNTSSPVPIAASQMVSVAVESIQSVPGTNLYLAHLRITNDAKRALDGPVSLAFGFPSREATLSAPTGYLFRTEPQGWPYVNVIPAGDHLGAGESRRVTVRIASNDSTAIQWRTAVYAGMGVR